MEAKEKGEACAPAGYARLLHLLTSREKMLMVLASRVHGNGQGLQPQACVVVGLLASQDTWERFEWAWRLAPVERPLNGQLSNLLRACGIIATGSAFRGRGSGTTVLRRVNSGLMPMRIEPCLLCFEHCVLDAARQVTRLPAEETVCFILDGSDALASAAMWHLEDLRSLAPRPTQERLGALGFESKREFPALQAAAWLASGCCERLQDPSWQEDRDTREGEYWTRFTLLDESFPSQILDGPAMAWRRNDSQA